MGGWIMSEKKDEDETQRMALEIMPLLKEFTEKIRDFCGRVSDFLENSRAAKEHPKKQPAEARQQMLNSLKFGFLRMQPPLTQLAQHASQLVTHGKVGPVTKLELALRNAEFEAALNEAQTILQLRAAA
jgi:hypothetical protein